MSSKEKLSGVFAPVVTPFLDDEIVYDKLAENIEKLNQSSLKGYLALGSNGEFKSLNHAEKEKVLKTILAARSEGKVVMAGTAAESTKETIELTQMAARLGADFASLLTPHYFKKRMTDAMLVGYFTQVADASEVPVLLYNAPGFTGLTLSPKVVAEAAAHPNIVGMKDTSTGNKDAYLAAAAGKEYYVLAGSASDFFPSLILGATGGVLSLANAFPQMCDKLYQLAIGGKIDQSCEVHRKIISANKSVSGSYGVAGVKAAMTLAGFFGGQPRLPLTPITDAQKTEMKDKLIQAGILNNG
ncbi:MAG: dihydrodipicolinate synthase family protein [Planctomycetota bacterium]|nr:dihydrodipicolinate synthase family protein [Planctomycetota bacterium]